MKNAKSKRYLNHLIGWLIWMIFVWLGSVATEEFLRLRVFILIILVSVPLHYGNVYILKKFFKKTKYAYYLLGLLLLIILAQFYFSGFNYLLAVNQDKEIISFKYENFYPPIIGLFFSTAAYLIGKLIKKEQELKILLIEQLKTELSLLKTQVNPHFLFNTLNNLYGLIVQNENEQAAKITLKLSDLMRYLLESSKTEQVSLQREVKFLEDYLVLEKIRLPAKADIRFDIYSLKKDIFVAPLLFIPLVENAFKHGLQSIPENSFAHFSLSVQGNDLFFEAKNSVGENLSTPEKSGTGIENLRKRLRLMYPEKHLLEVRQSGKCFKVILQISI